MNDTASRWVLAFDSSCGVCQRTSSQVAHACDHQLEVLPLADAEVERWRSTVYGAHPPWAPTLFLLRGDTTRAWTGRSMAIHMVRAIGLRSTLRVLRTLGQITAHAANPADTDNSRISRKRFLSQVLVGGAAASGLLLFGRLPAVAAPAPSPEEIWVQENLQRLPHSYDEFVGFDAAHRKAIFRSLPAETRSRMWVTQFQRYANTHPDLTVEQKRVLDHALNLAGQPSVFDEAALSADHRNQLEELRVTAIAAYGKAEGRALFTMLGPTDASAARAGCGCSCTSDWCDGGCICCGDCNNCHCGCSSVGCGTLLMSRCNGTCS